MRFTNVNLRGAGSVSCLLLDWEPDWSRGVELTAARPLHIEHGLTQREARRPLAAALRFSLRATLLLESGQLPALRNALQALTTQPILCPLWPARFTAGTSPTVAAGFYLLTDGTVAAHAALPFASDAWPLLVGALADVADPELITDELATWALRFIEDDALSATVTATPPSLSGPADGSGAARPVWPFRVEWSRAPQSGAATVEIERRALGQRRQRDTAAYTQPPRRKVTQHFLLEDAEPWQFLAAWRDAAAANFWLPAGLSEARLTADVGSGATALPVDDVTARGGNAEVLLDDGATRKALRVTGNSGATWTLGGAVGTAFLAAYTRVESLVLARLDSAEITLDFQEPWLASTDLVCVEVPHEIAAIVGDTLGTQQGALPETAYLYTFTVAYPDATRTWRFTGAERDLTYGGNTFASAPFEHGDIRETLALDRQTVNLKSRHFSDNPLGLLIPFALEWPLQLLIQEADVSGTAASNLRAVFRGQVSRASFDGPFISATVASLGGVFERKLPRMLIQPGCNWGLFDAACGVGARGGETMDSWRWNATVSTWSGAALTLVVTSPTRVAGGAVTLADHYFAGGYLKFGSGASAQDRMIGDSIGAGPITLQLGSPFVGTQPAAGNTVQIVPGCDGRIETCYAKFANRQRFGGMAFAPTGNPSLVQVKQTTGAGKK